VGGRDRLLRVCCGVGGSMRRLGRALGGSVRGSTGGAGWIFFVVMALADGGPFRVSTPRMSRARGWPKRSGFRLAAWPVHPDEPFLYVQLR